MDATLLTSQEFWVDPTPENAGEFAEIPELTGHVLFETSGSSGKPKWVALSKQALLVSAAAVNRYLEVTHDSRWGIALPLHHVGGFGVAARAYQANCSWSAFDGRWNPLVFQDWIERENVTHTSLVPTQVHDLVKADLAAPSSLTAIVVGGGHLDTLTGQAARDLGWPVLASYGMTETGSQIATQGLEVLGMPYRPAPIPLLPIWKVELSDDHRLRITGPALFSGYVSEGKFTPRESEWHTASDRVELDHEALTPLGRADTLVKILGELVDPEIIERQLVAYSKGELKAGTFAIVAIPDERTENSLVPVFEAGVNPAVIRRVLTVHKEQAPGFQRLQAARMIPELPRSELGKLRRATLAELCRNLEVID
ncbi:MAG: AMP-binding protein [Luteolibacter sp.]|uniref:AMP-binding protein n=1 Tax=Luteolibacter sp. TaxID=1962973 RepID=UPI003263B02D